MSATDGSHATGSHPLEADRLETCEVRPPAATGARLVSIDAYRGLVMVLLIMNGWGIYDLAKKVHELDAPAREVAFGQTEERVTVASTLAYHFEHVAWQGCALWDLIQPSFMFLVGVAVPFSMMNRRARGQSTAGILRHAATRSLILILLGMFLVSGIPAGFIRAADHILRNWTLKDIPLGMTLSYSYMNVLTQIGLGYCGLILLAGKPRWLQILTGVFVLVAYWGWFAFTPVPPISDFVPTVLERDSPVSKNVSNKLPFSNQDFEVGQFDGFSEHWSKHRNPAAAVDRWLLNVIPFRGQDFTLLGWKIKLPIHYDLNKGGYQTLNFIPSFVTMLFGLVIGEMLIAAPCRKRFAVWLIAGSVLALFAGQMLGQWEICPVVKRIWTPSFAVFSGGWLALILGGFILTTDVIQATSWTYLLRVIGANSILAYVFSQTISRPLVNGVSSLLAAPFMSLGYSDGIFVPVRQVVASIIVFTMAWIVFEKLYNRKIFLRI